MYIKGYDNKIEFSSSTSTSKVKVPGFMRNGSWVKGFVRKGRAAVQEQTISLAKVRAEDATSAAKVSAKALLNPSKTIKDGLAKEAALMQSISEIAGKEVSKKEVIKAGLGTATTAIANIRSNPKAVKELTINVGGFVGSRVTGASGIPLSGVAGDLVGARATRRAFDDRDVLKKVLTKLQGKNSYNEANRLKKISQIFIESRKEKQNQKELDRLNAAGDYAGWAGGNLAAAASPLNVPLTGALPGMITSALGEQYASLVPPKTAAEATAIILGDRIKSGNKREERIRKLAKMIK